MELSVQSVALMLAITVDVLIRELPNRWHPVAWMGNCIAAVVRQVGSLGSGGPLMSGAALVAGGSAVCWMIGYQIEQWTSRLPFLVQAVVHGIVLKQTLSIRSLARAARSVEAAVLKGDLGAARRELAFHLVSRDVSGLNESQIAAATIESVSENLSDSFVAPLFYYAVAGLPGALIYRYVNTCDAMIGYRSERFEWLGKPAARLDDALNLIPARLTAATILAWSVVRLRFWVTLRIWYRDAWATSSPNAGQPMSAAAGALGVELEKVGHYRLGVGQPVPRVADIGRSVQMLWGTSLLASLAILVALLLREKF